ncbi:MAG: NAD-dependent epimerase/dehydratase family protein, partial [Myxococcales bacterium]|nr:NAD-dependent epimerase/dehydratase family protein [Myxococcales bacterium]
RAWSPSTMRILVTGGAGFIGSNLCRLALAEGVVPVVVDDASGGVDFLPEGVERHRVAVADLPQRRDLLAGVDAVVHLAAKPSVDFANREPLAALDANVGDTLRALLAAADAGVPRFVCASSNAAAGNVAGPVHERVLPQPASVYGATKTAAEAFCSAVSLSHGLDAVSLRFSNCYGPHSDHKQSAVHLFVRKALAREPVVVFGDGDQTRDFIYVEDIARCILAAAAAPCGPVLQVGTGVETTVRELVAAIEKATGERLAVESAPPRMGDVRASVSDVRLAEEQLGWRPRVAFEEGIARTVAYYRERLGA